MFTFFGGKGGVGKTTCAAAWALARAAAGRRVLVLSTDPAHSLADVFDTAFRKNGPTEIRRRLLAMELDASSAVARWITTRHSSLVQLLDRGTLLDSDDIDQVLSLPVPGLDELAAFLLIATLARTGEHDEVVIDTAPTGHTIRLLEATSTIGDFAAVLDVMQGRHAMVAEALGARVRTSLVIEELRRDAGAVHALLRDPKRTTMRWVTIPEPIIMAETTRTLEWLVSRNFPVRGIVVNRFTAASRGGRAVAQCAECRARDIFERSSLTSLLAFLRRSAPGINVQMLPPLDREPRGARVLLRLGSELTNMPRTQQPFRVLGRQTRVRPPVTRDRAVLDLATARLLLFGGKGGVGKTTCAAGAALAIASDDADRPVLLMATDPASSLADVLSVPIGDAWTVIPGAGRMRAREVDAPARFQEYRSRYGQAVDEFFEGLRGASSVDLPGDRALFARLFDLAPPGIDELISLLTVMDVLETDSNALVIVDTAPTGHTLRLLSAQDDLGRWLGLLMRLIVKYRMATRAESFARELVALSRRLRAFSDLLTHRAQTRFVAVVRPEALPALETLRLVYRLNKLRIGVPTLVVNAESHGRCVSCVRRARAESRQIQQLRRSCRGRSHRCDIIHAPLQLPPPRGSRELLRWSRTWRFDGIE